jgi:hypothetical protein
MTRRGMLDGGGACYSERTDWTFSAATRRLLESVGGGSPPRPSCHSSQACPHAWTAEQRPATFGSAGLPAVSGVRRRVIRTRYWDASHRADFACGANRQRSSTVASVLDEDGGLDEIEDPLIEAIEAAGVGEFDGNEIGPDGAVLYCTAPMLMPFGTRSNRSHVQLGSVQARAIKRYGEPGSPEVRLDL